MYIIHPTHGAGTRPSRTQPPTGTRKTTLNAGQCVRQPREGRGRNRQTPPPPKKNRGGGGGARERPTATKPTANTTRGGQTPHQEGTEDRTPKGAQGDHPAKTGNTKPGTATHREKGHPKRADTHHAGTKKKSQQPSLKGRGWGDRGHKARYRDSQRPTPESQSKTRPKKQNTAREPNQEGRGTAETLAQHARPHSTAQPGKVGNKPGACTNTQPRTAPPARRCSRTHGTPARAHTHLNTPRKSGGAQPQPKPQHARPHRTPKPETAGCRQSAHATTHVQYAGRDPSPTTNTRNPGQQKRDYTTNRTKTHPPKT